MTPRSPAAAVLWSLRRRHRWGLIAIGAALLWIVTVKVVWLVRGEFPLALDAELSFALVCTMPMSLSYFYLVAVLTFGLDGDLAARQSMFPARLFTAPVTSAALAWWPMALGTVLVAALWIFTQLLGVWPPSIHMPAVWPGLLAIALLAWAQALTWLPYGMRGLRVVMVSLWLVTIDTITILALYLKASEPVMAAILVPQIPLAYLVGRYAVERARRGDTPSWALGSRLSALGTKPIAESLEPRATFASPERAQSWFEFRRVGRSLPVWVAALLPFELLLFWVAGTSTQLVIEFTLIALSTPVIMATFTATTVSSSSPGAGGAYGLPAFLATRPLTSAQLVAAKLRQTIRSTLAAWLVVVILLPIALVWSGASAVVIDRSRALAETVGAPRAIVFALLVVGAFVASTWKQAVQSLYIGLTGREWLIKGSVFVTIALLLGLAITVDWIVEEKHVGAVFRSLPIVFAVLVAIKMSAATWIAVRLHRDRLVADRTLVVGAACWCAAVFALYSVFTWLLDEPHFPRHVFMLVAILATPLARLSAAPLALAWNRHR